jgi:hypothetical protein
LGLVPALLFGAWFLVVPIVLALVLVAWFCAETHGKDLRALERAPAG